MKTLAERAYDSLHNEGCDGYNPHREARLDAERAAVDPRKVRLSAIERKLRTGTSCSARESGTELADAEVAALEAEAAAISSALQAESEAAIAAHGWTRETTIARRQAWNAAINAGRVTGRNGKVDWAKVAALEAEVGFSCDSLKRAISIHNL